MHEFAFPECPPTSFLSMCRMAIGKGQMQRAGKRARLGLLILPCFRLVM